MNQLGRIACGIWTPGWGFPDFLSVFLFLCFFFVEKKKEKNRVVCTFSLLGFSLSSLYS